MMGKTHREWGAVSSAALAAAFGNDPLNVAVCAFVGYHVARVPDQIEHPRMPLSPFRFHRGMSHSWELMVAPMMLAAWILPRGIDYLPWALALGILSHLTGDFLFGRAGRGRGAGIPLFLGRFHVGLGILKVNGWTEDGVYAILHALRYGLVGAAILYSVVHLAM